MRDVRVKISLYDVNDEIVEDNVLYSVDEMRFADGVVQIYYHGGKCDRKYNLDDEHTIISISYVGWK